MEYIVNSLFEKGDRKRIFQIIKLFVGGNFVFLLLGYLHYNQYDTPSNAAITLFFLTIILLGCNYVVYISIRSYNCVVRYIKINKDDIEINTKSLFTRKKSLIKLSKEIITVSKGTFEWNGHGHSARGIIIRDKKNKKEYYIIEAYFDEYDKLVEQLKS